MIAEGLKTTKKDERKSWGNGQIKQCNELMHDNRAVRREPLSRIKQKIRIYGGINQPSNSIDNTRKREPRKCQTSRLSIVRLTTKS